MTPDGAALPPEVADALGQLDDLLQMFAQHRDEALQDAVITMLRAVDVLHRGALQRLGAFLEARLLLDEALSDPHVALLFGLYGAQGPDNDDDRSRAEAAVARIRPDVEALGGRIEVVTAAGGVVNIQLSGGDDPYASSAMLRELVEESLRAELPEFVRLDLSPPIRKPLAPLEPTPVVIPLSALTRRRRASSSPEASASSDLGPSSQR